MIPFNKPFLTGKEAHYMYQAINLGKISGNGLYTKKCHLFFEEKYKFKKVLMTTSCTDALEMAAILSGIENGDEVIIPSYTFVSSALAFVRQGAKIIFADSCSNNPNIDADKIESLITSRTKVIVPVHYAGVACDMDKIMKIADKYNLLVVEDAAQAIDSYYKGKPLGGIGHFGCFSFHETKNIISGEGGMLVINDERFIKRSEIIWEKGTNRSEFFRGEVNKYGWVDVGSSFLPADYVAGFLYAQLENLEKIQKRRKQIWNIYFKELSSVAQLSLPYLPDYATNNAHMFYCICRNLEERTRLISYLKQNDILAVFHYLCLHESPFYASQYQGLNLSEAKRYDECLIRLPLYYDMTDEDVFEVVKYVKIFFNEL